MCVDSKKESRNISFKGSGKNINRPEALLVLVPAYHWVLAEAVQPLAPIAQPTNDKTVIKLLDYNRALNP